MGPGGARGGPDGRRSGRIHPWAPLLACAAALAAVLASGGANTNTHSGSSTSRPRTHLPTVLGMLNGSIAWGLTCVWDV